MSGLFAVVSSAFRVVILLNHVLEKRRDQEKQEEEQEGRQKCEKARQQEEVEQKKRKESQRIDNETKRHSVSLQDEQRTVRDDDTRLHHDSAFTNFPVYDYGRIMADAKLKDSGQAIVYHGIMMETTDSTTKEVAIKVFKETCGWDVCRRELDLLREISHPNVVEVLDFFEMPKPCFVMRFIAGGDLRGHLNKRGRFVGDDAIQLLLGIGEGLQHLHFHNIVHRDLKSPNILLEGSAGSFRPVLIDLGLGKKMENEKSYLLTSEKGTPIWMAPEMIQDNVWSKKTDIYALGILMWEVMTGLVPYADKGGKWQILYYVMVENGRPDTSELKTAGVSEAHVYINLMERLWHQEPSERPTTEEFPMLLSDVSTFRTCKSK